MTDYTAGTIRWLEAAHASGLIVQVEPIHEGTVDETQGVVIRDPECVTKILQVIHDIETVYYWTDKSDA